MFREVYLNAGVFPLPLQLICPDEWLTEAVTECAHADNMERKPWKKKLQVFIVLEKVSFPPRVGQRGLSPEKTKSIVVLWLSRYDVSYVIVDEALFQCVYMVDVLFYVFLWFWSAVSSPLPSPLQPTCSFTRNTLKVWPWRESADHH